MSQRDLVAEIRAARVSAPPQVREHVRLVAASAPAPARRFTWRRALVVVVPVAAAIAAAVVFTRPAERAATPTTPEAARTAGAAADSRTPVQKTLALPSSATRVQTYGATIALRVRDVANAAGRATRIATSLSGYVAAVHVQTHGRTGSGDLTLKVPRANVQRAVTRLSTLGTVTSQTVDITDEQAGLNETDRQIARLRTRLAQLRAAEPRDEQAISALTVQIQRLQRAATDTRRTAHFATVQLHLATPAAALKPSASHPWRDAAWAAGGAAALAVALLVAHVVRRRREDALLSRS
jgi:uncharacterized protein DUF4349